MYRPIEEWKVYIISRMNSFTRSFPRNNEIRQLRCFFMINFPERTRIVTRRIFARVVRNVKLIGTISRRQNSTIDVLPVPLILYRSKVVFDAVQGIPQISQHHLRARSRGDIPINSPRIYLSTSLYFYRWKKKQQKKQHRFFFHLKINRNTKRQNEIKREQGREEGR